MIGSHNKIITDILIDKTCKENIVSPFEMINKTVVSPEEVKVKTEEKMRY